MDNTQCRYSLTIREEELKNKVAHDFFSDYDTTQIIGNIDFCVSVPVQRQLSFFGRQSLLWAEAKSGKNKDIYESFVQLILTIGKARTFEKHIPPVLLGAFDAEKIAFVPYHAVMSVFHQNDFNWNVTPSNHDSKEFQQLDALVRATVENELLLFRFGEDDERLRTYIRQSFKKDGSDSRMEITKNNFISIYYHWRARVMPSISVKWENAKKHGILDADFYLADMLSRDNATLKEKLYVLLKSDHYEFARSIDELMGTISTTWATFSDGQKAHHQFWNQYRRPPREEFWDYIVDRRDLLVPGDIRERKGSFYTPRRWVELSQQYIADVLGEDWQDEYTVWDCAAGTGNLLAGLTNKYNIWASTLDQADVDVMKDRIANGANLLESHVFQFDFLNDDFNKCPEKLREILNDEEKRKKLLIYINPPYAEVSSKRESSNGTKGKKGVNKTKAHERYFEYLGTAARELYAQFLYTIYSNFKGCKIGCFSKIKCLIGPAFTTFRKNFRTKLSSLFLVPSSTFDNVNGAFPIGFFVYNTEQDELFYSIEADVYDDKGDFIEKKTISLVENDKNINKWISSYKPKGINCGIGFLDGINANDFQHNNIIYIVNSRSSVKNPRGIWIDKSNLMECSIFVAVRKVLTATWLNDRDQFLYPNATWEADKIFQTNCLAYTLLSNNISADHGVNHWIPFTEQEVDAKDAFASHFMTDYMSGKLGKKPSSGVQGSLLPELSNLPDKPLVFSPAAQAVFDAGREVWRYYHEQPDANPNAALYDIKAHFQGRSAGGRMNTTSSDAGYNDRMVALRAALATLAAQIAPKVYEHGFLKR